MKYGFEYQGNSIEILNYQYSEDDALRGNPYNSSFLMKVVSHDFAGVADCEYDRKEWDRFIIELELLYGFKQKEVIFKEICYGSEISFAMDNSGHLRVSGTIYGVHMAHSMKFEFDADQTVLPSFIERLKEL